MIRPILILGEPVDWLTTAVITCRNKDRLTRKHHQLCQESSTSSQWMLNSNDLDIPVSAPSRIILVFANESRGPRRSSASPELSLPAQLMSKPQPNRRLSPRAEASLAEMGHRCDGIGYQSRRICEKLSQGVRDELLHRQLGHERQLKGRVRRVHIFSVTMAGRSCLGY